jgi:hypothetical protein
MSMTVIFMTVIARSEAAKQSSLSCAAPDVLREACHRDGRRPDPVVRNDEASHLRAVRVFFDFFWSM